MRIEDAYKWLFHATLGGEHAVEDWKSVDHWMAREWATLGAPRHEEPWIEHLTPDGRLIRVNLRPYHALGGDRDMLTGLFFASAQYFQAKKDDFVREWTALGAYLRHCTFDHLSFRAWSRLDRETRRAGYPAIEHSDFYLKHEMPAYRVVLSNLWMPPAPKIAQ
jgi:hypothetical protein